MAAAMAASAATYHTFKVRTHDWRAYQHQDFKRETPLRITSSNAWPYLQCSILSSYVYGYSVCILIFPKQESRCVSNKTLPSGHSFLLLPDTSLFCQIFQIALENGALKYFLFRSFLQISPLLGVTHPHSIPKSASTRLHDSHCRPGPSRCSRPRRELPEGGKR